MIAASPSASSWWWRSIGAASEFGSAQRRISTPPTTAWSTPSSQALAPDPFLGRARVAVDLRRIAGVGVQQDQLADVVQQARDGEAVALLVADLGGDHRRRLLRGEGVQAEALGHGLPDAASARRSRMCARGPRASARCGGRAPSRRRGRSRRAAPALGARFARRSSGISSATSDSTAATTSPIGGCSWPTSDEQTVARLDERRKGLDRVEGFRQATTVALAAVALLGGRGFTARRRSRLGRRRRGGP